MSRLTPIEHVEYHHLGDLCASPFLGSGGDGFHLYRTQRDDVCGKSYGPFRR